MVYFVVISIYKISRMSDDAGPVRKRKQELELIELRLQHALKNPYLKQIKFEPPKFGLVVERYEQRMAALS